MGVFNGHLEGSLWFLNFSRIFVKTIGFRVRPITKSNSWDWAGSPSLGPLVSFQIMKHFPYPKPVLRAFLKHPEIGIVFGCSMLGADSK